MRQADVARHRSKKKRTRQEIIFVRINENDQYVEIMWIFTHAESCSTERNKKFPSSLFPCNRKTEPHREDYFWFHQQRTKLFVFFRSSKWQSWISSICGEKFEFDKKNVLNRKFLLNPFFYAFGCTPFSVTRARAWPLIDKQEICLTC